MSFQEVVWPTITVCNLNQIEASFLKDLGVYGNVELTNVLKNEFVLGRQGKLSPEHENLVNQIKDLVGPNLTFSNWSRQKCKDLFINVSFRGKYLTWRELPKDWKKEKDMGPFKYPTDFGIF